YPASYQDIAVVVASEVPAERVRDAVLAAAGDLLRSATIFDLYSGEQVGEGRKSLALRLEFRAPDRTLTDEEVGKRREAIKRALEKIGGSLRESPAGDPRGQRRTAARGRASPQGARRRRLRVRRPPGRSARAAPSAPGARDHDV